MDEAGRKKLWEEYDKTKSSAVREKIILEYAPLVKMVAGRLSMYLGYNVEYEDLVSYGIFGLIDAIDKFDALKDVKFETYASLRIRGAILDQIRKMDEEVAESLGISNDEYIDWQSQMKITNVVSLNEFLEQGSEIPNDNSFNRKAQFDEPEEVLERGELKRILAEALELLTEKERKVIVLYYYEDLTLKEISSILEVSESRTSQLHTRALQKMKTKLGSYMGILTER